MSENPYEAPKSAVPGPQPEGSVVAGFLLALGLHGLVVVAWALLSFFFDGAVVAFVPLMFIGVTQLVYLGPATALAISMKRHRTMTGILIVAGITFLLNAACFGVILLGFTGALQVGT